MKGLDIKKFENKPNTKQYKASDSENKIIWYVKTRFSEMKIARQNVDSDWETYQTMIDAIFVPYNDSEVHLLYH